MKGGSPRCARAPTPKSWSRFDGWTAVARRCNIKTVPQINAEMLIRKNAGYVIICAREIVKCPNESAFGMTSNFS